MRRPKILQVAILGGFLPLLITGDVSTGLAQTPGAASAHTSPVPDYPGTAVTLPFSMIPPATFSASYAQLPPAQKAKHDSVNDWAKQQNAHAVHQAWSHYTDAMVKQTLAREASYRTGKGAPGPATTVKPTAR